MGAEKKHITITIRGKQYTFRTEADSRRVREVEVLVNRRLEELDRRAEQERRPGVTDARLLILALLNISDEYLNHHRELLEIQERSERLLAELAAVGDIEAI